MSSKNKKKEKIDFISDILIKSNFEVKKEFKINERSYVDLLAIKDDKVIIFEVKPSGYKSDQSDFMQVSGYEGALSVKEEFRDKSISGCIISSGTVTPAIPLMNDLGIHNTGSDKKVDIKKEISVCIGEQ